MLKIDKLANVTEPDYKKNHPKSTKMWSKWWFFDFFSKSAPTILMKLGQNVKITNSRENRMSKKFHSWDTKFRFWREMTKVVSRSGYISRSVNATENLIQYLESTENSLSDCWHPFVHSSSYLTKFDSANFHVFLSCCWPFFHQPLDIFLSNSVRNETK